MPGQRSAAPFQPDVTQQYGIAPPPPPPQKRPIAILATLAVLLLAGVVTGSVLLVQGKFGRARNSVTGSQVAQLPSGPGVDQATGTALPSGPGIVSTPNGVPRPGQPVTSGTGKPDAGIPSVVMAPGSRVPSAPSVVTAPGVALPPGPNPVMAPGTTPKPTAPVTGLPSMPVVKPQAPAPPDNSDFDKYLRWLQYVEQERAGLRAQGETESFRMIDQFYQTMLGLADPDTNDAALQRQMDANLQVTLQRTVAAIRLFRSNVMRTKPPVPADCQALDRYYMSAMEQEGTTTAALMDAMARKDIGRIKMLSKSGVGSIDKDLGMANLKLEQVYKSRGLNQQFRIETGGNSSMLGGMLGLGGLH
jgi:hypothetical protein